MQQDLVIHTSQLLTQYAQGQRNFYGIVLNQANLYRAKLTFINLDEATLQKADLRYANLSGSNLNHADLSSANLAEAILMGADLIRVKLAGANLTNVLMSGANLSGANLRKADLSNASLIGANLSGVDFSGAILYRTNLKGANLKGANLSNTNLDQVDLSEVDLKETILSERQAEQLLRFVSTGVEPERDDDDSFLGYDPFSTTEYEGTKGTKDHPSDAFSLDNTYPGFFIDQRLDDQTNFLLPEGRFQAGLEDESSLEISSVSLEHATLLQEDLEDDNCVLSDYLPDSNSLLAEHQSISAPFTDTSTASTVHSDIVPASQDPIIDGLSHAWGDSTAVFEEALEDPESHKSLEDTDIELLLSPVSSAFKPQGLNRSSHLETKTPSKIQPQKLASHLRSGVAANNNSPIVQSLQSALQRRVQSNLQQSLLEAYSYRCAITRCSIRPLLETTLITTQNRVNSDHPTNGLVLRNDIKSLYRLHLIAIDPKRLTILVAPSLKDSDYGYLQGKKIFLPADPSMHPKPQFLAEHLQACKWFASLTEPNSQTRFHAKFPLLENLVPSVNFSRFKIATKASTLSVGIGGMAGILLLSGLVWMEYRSPMGRVWLNSLLGNQSAVQARVSLQGEAHPIDIQLDPILYPQQGIIVDGSAYIPLHLIRELGIRPEQISQDLSVEYQGKPYLKATGLKNLGTEITWNAAQRLMSLKGQSKLELQPINLQMQDKEYSQAGIIVNTTAYVPTQLVAQTSSGLAKVADDAYIQYAGDSYVRAAELKNLALSVEWDKETRTLKIKQPI